MLDEISRLPDEMLETLSEAEDEEEAQEMAEQRNMLSGVNGQTGNFQKYLIAYNREGLPCSLCRKHKIRREKIGSRSAHFCPRCQRLR